MAPEDGIEKSTAWREDAERALNYSRACIALATGGHDEVDGQRPEDFVREAYLSVGVRADLETVLDCILRAIDLAANQAEVS